MKSSKTIVRIICAAFCLATAFAQAQISPTALTYNGKLTDGTNGVNGWYDFALAVFPNATGGSTLGNGTQTNSHVAVIAGSFTVTADFGTNLFNGSARWLELAVRTNGGNSFATMTPRYTIGSVPVAQYALTPAGPQGAQGIQGLQGIAGINGTNGIDGTNGLNGATGAMGLTGSQGAQGIQGIPGLNGTNGVNGTNGLTGATGPQGVPGPQGVVGATGAQGIQGIAGSNGTNGVNGINGTNGATGPAGPLLPDVALTDTNQTFTGANTFSGVMLATNAGNQFAGNGAGLTNLDYNNIANPPTIPTDVAGAGLAKTGNTFSIPASGVANAMLANPGVTLNTASPLSGGGTVNLGGMLNLSLTGIIPLTQLPAEVVTNNATGVTMGGTFSGDGRGLTNLNVANGVNGTNGLNATIIVTNVLTGAVGSSATATNVGTATAAILQFTIPQGLPGTNGAAGPQGPQGIQGPQGPSGAVGAQGVPGVNGVNGVNGTNGLNGAAGAQGLAGVPGLVWRSAWNGAAAYNSNDAVSYNGSAFVALLTNANIPPGDGTNWTLLASKGDTGPAGTPPAGVVTNNQSGVTLSGTFLGDGSGLTNLPVGFGGLAGLSSPVAMNTETIYQATNSGFLWGALTHISQINFTSRS